ncbi:MAG: hypothetical protein ACLFV2_06885 [Desulfurivibrionaceae bacterium]
MVLPVYWIDTLCAAEHDFSIGFDAMFMDYEESGAMEEDGDLYGVTGKYTFHGRWHGRWMCEAGLRYLEGDLDYEGRTFGGSPAVAESEDWVMEARFLVGRDYGPKRGILVTPFSGMGYRFWNSDIQGAEGYEREVEYLYSPVGVRLSSSLSPNWDLGLSAEYDIFWGGNVKTYLSDVDPGFSDPEVDQDAGYGYGLKLSASLERRLSPGYTLAVEPYLNYWDIDDSDREIVYYNGVGFFEVYEPENKTTSYGCRINLIF